MSEVMNASVLTAPGVLEFKKIAKPKPLRGELLIRVAYTGICGSDLPRSNLEKGARLYPLVLGHEFSGLVEELGEGVEGFKKSDRICVAPLIPDPNCAYTKEGLYGLSENYNLIGTCSNGSLAEFVCVPKEHVLKISDDLDLLSACGVEPCSIAWHAATRVDIKAGDSVAVLGCGPIGQLAIQAAKIFGAKSVIAVDIFDEKLKLAKKLGADFTVNSKNKDLLEEVKKITTLGVDVVMETAGSSFTQRQSLLITRKRGRIVFVGISHQDLNLLANEAERILRAELSITGSWNSYTSPYPGRAWTSSLDEMQKGRIRFKELISHKISLQELGSFLPKMFKREIEFNKVIVDVGGNLC